MLLINAQPKSNNDDNAANDSTRRCFLPQEQVSENDIENGSKRTADVIEGDSNEFQAQIVESDHRDEYNR